MLPVFYARIGPPPRSGQYEVTSLGFGPGPSGITVILVRLKGGPIRDKSKFGTERLVLVTYDSNTNLWLKDL